MPTSEAGNPFVAFADFCSRLICTGQVDRQHTLDGLELNEETSIDTQVKLEQKDTKETKNPIRPRRPANEIHTTLETPHAT